MQREQPILSGELAAEQCPYRVPATATREARGMAEATGSTGVVGGPTLSIVADESAFGLREHHRSLFASPHDGTSSFVVGPHATEFSKSLVSP